MPASKPKQRRGRRSRHEIIEAIESTGGILAAAARKLGASRSTLYRWIERDEKVRQAYEDINQTVGDEMEGRFLQICRDPEHPDNFKALRFYLRTKLRDRGYSDRVDDTGATDLSGNITVLHSIPGLEE